MAGREVGAGRPERSERSDRWRRWATSFRTSTVWRGKPCGSRNRVTALQQAGQQSNPLGCSGRFGFLATRAGDYHFLSNTAMWVVSLPSIHVEASCPTRVCSRRCFAARRNAAGLHRYARPCDAHEKGWTSSSLPATKRTSSRHMPTASG